MSIDKHKIEAAIKDLIIAIGEDPDREGLIETPARVANMYEELFSGMERNPKQYLKTFDEPNNDNDIVFVKDIPLHSMCEHHLLPFVGKAHVAYVPKNNKIIGLSKLSRIVNCFAKRLQVQERLTSEIADFISDNLETYGTAVIIEAEHLCMTMRGAKVYGSKTQTSKFTGIFRADVDKRLEVISFLLSKSS